MECAASAHVRRSVAEAARLKDKLDEEELWSSFADHLLKFGVGADDVVNQVVELAVILSRARAAHARVQEEHKVSVVF